MDLIRVRSRTILPFAICAALLAAAGCARVYEKARRDADEAAYAVISEKQRQALGESGKFTIEPAGADALTSRVLTAADRLDWARLEYTTPTLLVSLDEAFALAVANNRAYQSRRESLYSQALGLTQTRWNFGPIYNASGDADLTRQESDLGIDNSVEHFGGYNFTVGASRLLATGARISMNLTHEFTRFLTNSPRPSAANALSASIVQPLLRGGGLLETLEPLRQDERSLVYSVRDFRRYQQGFVIDVAQRYYNLLSGHDQVRNAQTNYDSARRNLTMLERLAETGNRSDIEVDQARQNFLQAEANLSRTQANYGRQLDQFKFFLGLPLDLDLGPDPAELERLGTRGLLRPDLDLRQAIQTALDQRLDFKTQQNRLEDSERHVALARRQFLPVLDVSFSYSTSQSDDEDRIRLDFRNNTTRGGLNLDLPLDWTPRRNNYRLALIERQQAERALSELHDALVLEVTDAWRQLEDLQFNYGIQQQAVRLAERRVRSTSLLLQMGRATTRDLLESEDALLASRNALTTALVNYTIQRLQFWNAIERLEIDPKGMWYE